MAEIGYSNAYVVLPPLLVDRLHIFTSVYHLTAFSRLQSHMSSCQKSAICDFFEPVLHCFVGGLARSTQAPNPPRTIGFLFTFTNPAKRRMEQLTNRKCFSITVLIGSHSTVSSIEVGEESSISSLLPVLPCSKTRSVQCASLCLL